MSQSKKESLTNLHAVIAEAEKVVGGVTDPELRRVAFDRVLQHFLQSSQHVGKPPPHAPARVKADKGSTKPGPKTWLQELADEGFFATPKHLAAIREALDERGHILKPQDLTAPLANLVKEKVLRRKKMSAQEGGKAQVHWYNW